MPSLQHQPSRPGSSTLPHQVVPSPTNQQRAMAQSQDPAAKPTQNGGPDTAAAPFQNDNTTVVASATSAVSVPCNLTPSTISSSMSSGEIVGSPHVGTASAHKSPPGMSSGSPVHSPSGQKKSKKRKRKKCETSPSVQNVSHLTVGQTHSTTVTNPVSKNSMPNSREEFITRTFGSIMSDKLGVGCSTAAWSPSTPSTLDPIAQNPILRQALHPQRTTSCQLSATMPHNSHGEFTHSGYEHLVRVDGVQQCPFNEFEEDSGASSSSPSLANTPMSLSFSSSYFAPQDSVTQDQRAAQSPAPYQVMMAPQHSLGSRRAVSTQSPLNQQIPATQCLMPQQFAAAHHAAMTKTRAAIQPLGFSGNSSQAQPDLVRSLLRRQELQNLAKAYNIEGHDGDEIAMQNHPCWRQNG